MNSELTKTFECVEHNGDAQSIIDAITELGAQVISSHLNHEEEEWTVIVSVPEKLSKGFWNRVEEKLEENY